MRPRDFVRKFHQTTTEKIDSQFGLPNGKIVKERNLARVGWVQFQSRSEKLTRVINDAAQALGSHIRGACFFSGWAQVSARPWFEQQPCHSNSVICLTAIIAN
jgi:hypothetical protein